MPIGRRFQEARRRARVLLNVRAKEFRLLS
jgi:hypothetical protein